MIIQFLLREPSFLKQGDSDKVNTLIQEMKNGDVGALITYKVNPSYNLSNAKEFNKALSSVDVKFPPHHIKMKQLV